MDANAEEPLALNKTLRKGIFFITIAFLFMAMFGVLLKTALHATSALWVNFIAYATGLTLITTTLSRKQLSYFKTPYLSYHFGRAFFGVLASFLYISSLHYIPLLNATLLFNTTPLFIPLFIRFFLPEKTHLTTWLSIVLGFLGIILMLQPKEESFGRLGDIIGLCAGMSLALAYTYIKLLATHEPNFKIIFYFFLLATFLQLPFLPLAGPPPLFQETLLPMLAGSCLFLAQWFIVKAYRNAEASKIGVFQYTTIIWVGVIDWIVWEVRPNQLEFIGALVVIIAAMMILKSSKT